MKKSRGNKSINIKNVLTEISLITVGALVGIAVDNWNTNRLFKIEVDDYLSEIKSEIQTGIEF